MLDDTILMYLWLIFGLYHFVRVYYHDIKGNTDKACFAMLWVIFSFMMATHNGF